MKNETNEYVQKIDSCYVGDDCVQLMIPYENGLTMLNKNGVFYHHKVGTDDIVNNYINDERRKQFPYHNIPIHYEKSTFKGNLVYTNQLLDYEIPYVKIKDGNIIETFVVKDGDGALTINKFISNTNKKTSFKTRKELDEMFDKSSIENETYYFLDELGTLVNGNNLKLPDENQIFDYKKRELLKSLNVIKQYINDYSGTSLAQHMRENPLFLECVKDNIDNFDLKKYNFDIQLLPGALVGDRILSVKVDGNDISIQEINVYFIATDYYKVDTYELPITKYTLEQIKYLKSNIIKPKEPKYSLKSNPWIKKEDVNREKQKVNQLKK